MSCREQILRRFTPRGSKPPGRSALRWSFVLPFAAIFYIHRLEKQLDRDVQLTDAGDDFF